MPIDPGLQRLALGTILAAFVGKNAPEWLLALLADGLAGVTLFGTNIENPKQTADLTTRLRSVRRDTLIATDEEGGDVTRLAHRTGSPYPGNAALGVVDDVLSTRMAYASIGSELAACGITLNFAPVADVNTTDDNPVIGTRSFGSDPALVARHTAAAVAGLQSAGVLACTKHFPGHGATRTDSHLGLPVVDVPIPVLRERDLPPFAAAIAAGTAAIMTAHLRIPALTGAGPATFSRAVLQDLLRHEYAFSGAIITDALEMRGAAEVAGGPGPAAVLALAAGADLLCLGAHVTPALVDTVVTDIVTAVADGRLPRTRLEDAAARTAALTPAAGAPAADAPIAGIGWEVARRALRVEGSAEGFGNALVVKLHTGPTIVEGRVPWGLGVPALSIAAASTSPDELIGRAGSRPIVIIGRRLHRTEESRYLIESLTRRHTGAVVEMGWPSDWRPTSARAFLTTYGAGEVNGRAAAAALGLLHPRD
ncbi:glycoside hydrolase family 3 protein [Winogradskya consettensis]|uniref:Sugar hydrolase n=1 Tax=Winogradskya consettensis TaxID=113560 RepID=A0A919SC09_9ACTN|nr:glycoside hydrolase family 3 protein [Actinoplanes consettensis]GIM68915.1 sugar hydrolase [Actinoplanes consettensis]